MPPGRFWLRAGVEFLEGEAEEEAQGDQQQHSEDGRRHGHSDVLYQRRAATDSAAPDCATPDCEAPDSATPDCAAPDSTTARQPGTRQ